MSTCLFHTSHMLSRQFTEQKKSHTETHTHTLRHVQSHILRRREGCGEEKQSLTGGSPSTGVTRGAEHRENVSASTPKKKKSDERDVFPRAPLCHQINFTLSHLAAAVMSFIHPLPRSHGNPAAWSRSFFYICLRSTSLPPFSRCRRT